jgi:hypothetical protein
LVGLFILVLLKVTLAGEMLVVAAKGGGVEAGLPGSKR